MGVTQSLFSRGTTATMSSLPLLASRISRVIVRSRPHSTSTSSGGSLYHAACCGKCMPKYNPGSQLGVGPGVLVMAALFGLASLINPINDHTKDYSKM